MEVWVSTYRLISRWLHRFWTPLTRLSVLSDLFAWVGWFNLSRLFMLSLLMQACVREQTDDCVQYEMKISAVDPQGVDVTSSGIVTSINLYLFDDNGFVRIIPQNSSSSFILGTEKSKVLTLVAWGNLKGDSLKLPSLSVGTSLQNARIKLLQSTEGYNLPTTDLFYSRREINNVATRSMQSDTVKLIMERLVSALSVRVSHPEEYFGDVADLYIVVRGTGTSLNFMGETSEDEAGYAPGMKQLTGADEWVTPLFRIFPTDENRQIFIDLYRENNLLMTITTDDYGNVLRALPGKETYVTVDFRYARMHVFFSVKPWEDTDQDVQL